MSEMSQLTDTTPAPGLEPLQVDVIEAARLLLSRHVRSSSLSAVIRWRRCTVSRDRSAYGAEKS
jgi:hypothetical protein